MSIEQLENQLKDQQAEINGLWKTLYELAYDVKRLEQKQSDYPTKEEIPYIKIGLTD